MLRGCMRFVIVLKDIGENITITIWRKNVKRCGNDYSCS